jgi:type IV pilus assembly protein PilM
MSAARRSRPTSWFTSPPPSIGIEIGASRVTAVVLSDRGGTPTVTAHATERLPAGVVTPSLNQTNIHDRAAVAGAVSRVLAALGQRATRLALVIPDAATKVSIVRFDKLPARAADLDQLVRWQVKKSVPFPIEQAQVSWMPGAKDAAGGAEFVVVLARRDIIEEYEAACRAANVHAGMVDLATFNLINLALAANPSLATVNGTAPDGKTIGKPGALPDWLLVHVASDSSTIAIVRGSHLLFFRNRPAEAEGRLSDLVHQTAMYYEDRLGGPGFSRVLVTARDVPEEAANEVEQLYRGLAERAGDRIEALDVRGAAPLADRIAPGQELLQALAAPVGAVLRERYA